MAWRGMARTFVYPWEWGVEDYLQYAMFTINKIVKNIAHSFSVGEEVDGAQKDFEPLTWGQVEVDDTNTLKNIFSCPRQLCRL